MYVLLCVRYVCVIDEQGLKECLNNANERVKHTRRSTLNDFNIKEGGQKAENDPASVDNEELSSDSVGREQMKVRRGSTVKALASAFDK